jgi:hypothetical protein
VFWVQSPSTSGSDCFELPDADRRLPFITSVWNRALDDDSTRPEASTLPASSQGSVDVHSVDPDQIKPIAAECDLLVVSHREEPGSASLAQWTSGAIETIVRGGAVYWEMETLPEANVRDESVRSIADALRTELVDRGYPPAEIQVLPCEGAESALCLRWIRAVLGVPAPRTVALISPVRLGPRLLRRPGAIRNAPGSGHANEDQSFSRADTDASLRRVIQTLFAAKVQ